jgi:phosphoribosylglycinamide formyltransferase-1
MADSVENRPVPLAILISGRGSNMRAIVEAIGAGQVRGVVKVVIANRADAAGIPWAREAGIETLVLPHRDYPSRDGYDQALLDAITARGVQIVCLAGFMRLLGPRFCDAFPHAILNVHPSLLPSFPGEDAQGQALRHGVKVSGATVHFVTPELDAGPIIMQSPVAVKDDDTVETLSARILVQEHVIYPEALQRVIAGGWHIDGRRFTRVAGPSASSLL